MALLSDIVAACDEAAEQHGVEKVRTIGSSYLAVSGLSVERPDHTARMVQFANDVVRIVKRFNAERGVHLVAEIGINAGPVIGGLVGRRKFIYDLWGDTVKLARGIESDGKNVDPRDPSRLRSRTRSCPVRFRHQRQCARHGPGRAVLPSGGGRGMSELLNQLQGRWAFALGLAIGFPLLLVVLSEVGLALERAGHPVAASFRSPPHLGASSRCRRTLSPLGLLLPETSLIVRIIETLCWATVIVAIMGIVNNLVFE